MAIWALQLCSSWKIIRPRNFYSGKGWSISYSTQWWISQCGPFLWGLCSWSLTSHYWKLANIAAGKHCTVHIHLEAGSPECWSVWEPGEARTSHQDEALALRVTFKVFSLFSPKQTIHHCHWLVHQHKGLLAVWPINPQCMRTESLLQGRKAQSNFPRPETWPHWAPRPDLRFVINRAHLRSTKLSCEEIDFHMFYVWEAHESSGEARSWPALIK